MSTPNPNDPSPQPMVTTADMDTIARSVAHQALDRRVGYYAPSPDAVAAHEAMRAAVASLGHRAIEVCPNAPELREALRKLTDEVLAGFNAAIARNHDRLRPAAELVDHPTADVTAE